VGDSSAPNSQQPTPDTPRTVAYGPERRPVELPEGTRVVEPNPPLEPLVDFERAVREALVAPLGHEPLDRLVGRSSTVTIAFDDPAGPSYPRPEGWRDAR
jgi:hypothetical protein